LNRPAPKSSTKRLSQRKAGPRPLWKISVSTGREAEEALAELLASVFGGNVTSYRNAETGATNVSLYFEARKAWSAEAKIQLLAGIKRVKSCGLETGPASVSVQRVRREDWAESWKRHFQPLEIGSALLIRPSWSHQRPRKGQKSIVLDPGLSFGTGQHPTTAFCLREIASRHKPGREQSMLDLGPGSGILAIAAAKLGYAPVHALEYDPDALRIARENARRNGVAHKIEFALNDVTQMPSTSPLKYSLVCANLISNLLISERAKLVSCLAPGGILVLAGILKTEFEAVERAYQAVRFLAIKTTARGEWRSGAFIYMP
jgi:ribosomal protein L11 methyltransferase